MQTKKCAKCGEIKEIGAFAKYARSADGYQSYCKQCINEYQKAKRKEGKEPKPVAKEGHKICNKCGEEKLLDQFHKYSLSKDGHKGECKDCMCARSREYQEKNADKVKANKQAYRNSEEGKAVERAYAKKKYEENREEILAKHKEWEERNREYRLQYHREYNAAHREEAKLYRIKNRDRNSEYGRIWRLNNKGLNCAKTAKRRAALKRALPKWADLNAIKEIYKQASLLRAQGIDVHVDHIDPLQSDLVCGLHVETNLRIVPGKENLSRNNKFEAYSISS